MRDPERATHRFAGLNVPLAGAVADDGVSVVLDRSDPQRGLHRLCVFGADGRLRHAHPVLGDRVDLEIDLAARRLFVLSAPRAGEQVLTAHRLDDGARVWRLLLALDRPELVLRHGQRLVELRHRRSPPRMPYVYRLDYAGRLVGRLPADGVSAFRLAESAWTIGHVTTARSLIGHALESPLPASIAERARALADRLRSAPGAQAHPQAARPVAPRMDPVR